MQSSKHNNFCAEQPCSCAQLSLLCIISSLLFSFYAWISTFSVPVCCVFLCKSLCQSLVASSVCFVTAISFISLSILVANTIIIIMSFTFQVLQVIKQKIPKDGHDYNHLLFQQYIFCNNRCLDKMLNETQL